MVYSKTPIVQLESDIIENAGLSLWLKREELNHQEISGNKWWKLKYNLEQARKEGHSMILTFGGAYSNHLYATAAAAAEMGFTSVGVVRGEEPDRLSPTLAFAKSKGMRLHFVSRQKYNEKSTKDFITELQNEYGEFYLIPEGGTNQLAIEGVEEWASMLEDEINFDYLCTPVGTGGTIAGMINNLRSKKVVGFSSLKGGDFLKLEIERWLRNRSNNWEVNTQYHFGGYGKVKSELIEFIQQFEETYNIRLDPVYTAKMMFGIFDMIEQGYFERGTTILALHTGGLQGRAGFNF